MTSLMMTISASIGNGLRHRALAPAALDDVWCNPDPNRFI
jgi:hypothetical protein